MFRSQRRTGRTWAGSEMVADAIVGAIRILDASIPPRGPAERGSFWWVTNRGKHTMEYLIIIGVAAMVALYTLIIARCLKAPEWQ